VRITPKMLGTFIDQVLYFAASQPQSKHLTVSPDVTQPKTIPIPFIVAIILSFFESANLAQKENDVKCTMMMNAETISFKFCYSL
jgi:hypothetical protein